MKNFFEKTIDKIQKVCYNNTVDRPKGLKINNNADMAELADALASGASPRKGVKVQVLLSASCFGRKEDRKAGLLFVMLL